jgi:hypothetical protein
MFSYIDTAGVNVLKTTILGYESIGIKTHLANCAEHVVKMLEKDNFYNEVPPHHVYITIHDPIHQALDDQKGIVDDGQSNQLNTLIEVDLTEENGNEI